MVHETGGATRTGAQRSLSCQAASPATQQTRETRPRVVVVGAGFGGLAAVHAMRKKPLDITWIDRRNHHLFQPLLYQVATAALSPADIACPVRETARRARNITVLWDEVVDVDLQRKRVLTRDRAIPYDYLILATGSETSYFRNEAWRQFAHGLKTLDEAISIRQRILIALETAEMAATEEERRRLLRFVLIGAGPTGTEMAGAIAELAKGMLARDYPHIEPTTISIVLLEAMDQVLPGFPRDLADYTERKLTEMGVQVRTGAMVEAIDEAGVVAGGDRIDAHLVIWSAGVKATPVAPWLGCESDNKGRVEIKADLTLPRHPEVFLIGDAALCRDEDGNPLPGLAAVAKQQGSFAARRIAAIVAGRQPPEKFRYRDWGVLATVGRGSAVADLKRLRLRGFGAWLVWAFVHIWYLIDFRNRVRVLVNWIWQYAAYVPGAGLILRSKEG